MLRIILGILKLIGILLAVILFLFLGILLIILLTPLRYRGTVEKTEANARADIYVSWLFRFISVAYSFDLIKKQQKLIIRICGVPLTSILGFFKKISEGKKKLRAGKNKGDSEKGTPKLPEAVKSEPSDAVQEDLEAEAEPSYVIEEEPVKETDPDPVDTARQEPDNSPGTESSGESKQQAIHPTKVKTKQKKERKVLKKLQELYSMLNERTHDLERLYEKISAVPDKISGYMRMLEEYEVKEVLGEVLQEVFGLLKRYLPRRMTGYLRFGLSDPSSTGKLTGLLYILLPAKAAAFRIEPEFNQTVLETEVTLSGRIRPCHAVIMALRLLLNKRLIRMIKKLLSLRSK